MVLEQTVVIGNNIIALLYAFINDHKFIPVNYDYVKDNSYIKKGILPFNSVHFTKSINENNEKIEIDCKMTELEVYLLFWMGLKGKVISSDFEYVAVTEKKIVLKNSLNKMTIKYSNAIIINPNTSWGNFENYNFNVTKDHDIRLVRDVFELEPRLHTNVDIISSKNLNIHLIGMTTKESSYKYIGISSFKIKEKNLEKFENSEIYTKFNITSLIQRKLKRYSIEDCRFNIIKRDILEIEPLDIKNTKNIEFKCINHSNNLLDALRRMDHRSTTTVGMIQRYQ